MLMETSKPWYTSITIWNSVMGFLVSALAAFNLVNLDQSKILIAEGPQFIAAFAAMCFSLGSLYGRVVAKRTIGEKPPAAKPNVPAQPIAPSPPLASDEPVG